MQQVRQNKAERSSYLDENKDDEGIETGPGDAYVDEDDSDCGEDDLSSQQGSSPGAAEITEIHFPTDLPLESTVSTSPELLDPESSVDGSGFHDYSDMDGFEFVKVELTQQDDKFADDSAVEESTAALNLDQHRSACCHLEDSDVSESSANQTEPQLEEIDVLITGENSLDIPIEEVAAVTDDASTVGDSLLVAA